MMRHLNSGEIRLFNIRTDYREEHDLRGSMLEKVSEMDAILRKYVEEVEGGSAEQVREALYRMMDRFSSQAKEGFRKRLAELDQENPYDLETQKAALLKELNQKLKKNAINKEKTRLHARLHSWREGPSKSEAEEHVEAEWVDLTVEQVLQKMP